MASNITLTKAQLDVVFESLKAPVEVLMKKHGIKTKKNKQWVNLSRCPWCGHGEKDHNNYQCGISESPAHNGGYLHAVKCQHPHNSETGDASPHYADFLVALGELTPHEADVVKKVRNSNTVRNVYTPPTEAVATSLELGIINEENNRKGRRRLEAKTEAMHYLLSSRGYSMATIEEFKLGLSEPYEKDGKLIHAAALTAPLRGIDGRFYKKYVNYAIPGVTIDNREKRQKAWSPGAAKAYYAGNSLHHPWLFVCDGLKDVWALAQLLKGSDLEQELALVSSTNGGGGLPEEWRQPSYWERWERVFAGHDNDQADALTGKRAGDEHARALAQVADTEVFRVAPPGVKDWNDWVLAGGTIEAFRKLLEQSELLPAVTEIQSDDDGVSAGRFNVKPLSLAGSYHNGYFYEAISTLVRRYDEDSGESTEFYDTIVIRSDRTQHRARRMPAPKGTPENRQVWRLHPDGSVLSGPPEPNPHLTWEWPAVQAWLNRKDRTPSLSNMLEHILAHLKGATWLPYEDDYAILACATAASYVQQIFDAVPLILMNGEAGTGKSAMGTALKSIGANCSQALGVVSAATLARHIDAARGLTVLDDIEDIGKTKSKDGAFGELMQTLKLSYNKTTAMKNITDPKTGLPRQFNFFGVKILGNTSGTDAILGSRMLIVQTRKMPKGLKVVPSELSTPDKLTKLRNQLHTWAFNNVTEVAEAYQSIFPNRSSRQEEIAAPLRVVAHLSGNPKLSESLERALARQSQQRANPDSPEVIMREALESLIHRSIETTGTYSTWVTVTQLMMEMSVLVDNNYGKEFTTSLASIEKPEWVGRSLRQTYADPSAEQQRTNMYGKGLRAYKLADDFVEEAIGKLKEKNEAYAQLAMTPVEDFKAFCSGCATCPYSNRCDMQAVREAKATKERAPGRTH